MEPPTSLHLRQSKPNPLSCDGIAQLPDLLAHGSIGLLKHNLIKETAFESRIEVVSEIGGGNHDAVQILHLLKDKIVHNFVFCIKVLYIFASQLNIKTMSKAIILSRVSTQEWH